VYLNNRVPRLNTYAAFPPATTSTPSRNVIARPKSLCAEGLGAVSLWTCCQPVAVRFRTMTWPLSRALGTPMNATSSRMRPLHRSRNRGIPRGSASTSLSLNSATSVCSGKAASAVGAIAMVANAVTYAITPARTDIVLMSVSLCQLRWRHMWNVRPTCRVPCPTEVCSATGVLHIIVRIDAQSSCNHSR
jgi:hypothetical protein